MASRPLVYLIGSLRNPDIATVGNEIRKLGLDVYDDWKASGPEADEEWRKYELARGRTYLEALSGRHAGDIFETDKKYLDRAAAGVMILPAGRSAFAEMGYLAGQGKPVFILLDDHERWDIMLRFATGVFTDLDSLLIAVSCRV